MPFHQESRTSVHRSTCNGEVNDYFVLSKLNFNVLEPYNILSS